MTAAQIAKAIEYLADRTEIALERMQQDGQVVRSEAGRWSIGLSAVLHCPIIGAAGISGKLSVLSRGIVTGISFAEQCQRRVKSFLPGFNQLGFFGLLFAQDECRLSVGFQASQVRASSLK